MKKMLSVLLATATALSVCGGLTACGGDGKTLTVWAPSAAIPIYKQVAASFKTEYPAYKDYTIKFEAMEEDKVQDNIGPDPSTKPHVFFFPSDHINAMRKYNALQPLTETYVDLVTGRDEEKVWKDAIREDANGVDQIYAFPATYDNGYFLYYDKTFYTNPADVEYLDTLQSRASANNKQILYAIGSGFYSASMFFSAGITFGYTDDTLEKYETNLDSPAGHAVGAACYNYFNPGKNGSGTSQTIIDGDVNTGIGKGFADGTMVAAIGGTWAYANIRDQMAAAGKDIKNIGMTVLPKFRYELNGPQEARMTSFIGYKYCGVNGRKPAEQIKASLALAAHLTSEEAQYKRFEKLKAGPSNKNLLENNDEVKNDELLKAFHAQEEWGTPQYDHPSAFWSNTFIKDIMSGTTKAGDVSDAITAWSNNLLGKSND